jgi:hypothetical protein
MDVRGASPVTSMHQRSIATLWTDLLEAILRFEQVEPGTTSDLLFFHQLGRFRVESLLSFLVTVPE